MLKKKSVSNACQRKLKRFTRKREFLDFHYILTCARLEQVESIIDLSVAFDKTWLFVPRYRDNCAEAHRNLGFIIRLTRDFRH